MSHEKQINKDSWQTRLDAIDSLPGENHRDMNPLWERLHTRLGKKKKQYGAAWYWAGAAASLIILLRIFFVSDINQDQAVAVQSMQKKQQPAVAKETKQPIPLLDKTASTAVIKPLKTLPGKQKKIFSLSPVEIEKKAISVPSPSLVITPAPDSIQKNMAVTVAEQPKKKMRVVHINRLENYIEQKATKDYFTTNSKDGLIKIKLSPSN